MTRVKELLANGNNVSFGHDDIFDPWYPLGTGNMRDVIFMGLHVCQMMGYQEIMDSYRLCTYNAAKTLHLSGYGIAEGNDASFIILDGDNFYNALNRKGEVLRSYNKGRLIASTQRSTVTEKRSFAAAPEISRRGRFLCVSPAERRERPSRLKDLIKSNRLYKIAD